MFANIYVVRQAYQYSELAAAAASADAKGHTPKFPSLSSTSTVTTSSSYNTSPRHGQYVDLTIKQCEVMLMLQIESKNSSQHNQSKKAHRNG
jgi:hypothetical protein